MQHYCGVAKMKSNYINIKWESETGAKKQNIQNNHCQMK